MENHYDRSRFHTLSSTRFPLSFFLFLLQWWFMSKSVRAGLRSPRQNRSWDARDLSKHVTGPLGADVRPSRGLQVRESPAPPWERARRQDQHRSRTSKTKTRRETLVQVSSLFAAERREDRVRSVLVNKRPPVVTHPLICDCWSTDDCAHPRIYFLSRLKAHEYTRFKVNKNFSPLSAELYRARHVV